MVSGLWEFWQTQHNVCEYYGQSPLTFLKVNFETKKVITKIWLIFFIDVSPTSLCTTLFCTSFCFYLSYMDTENCI